MSRSLSERAVLVTFVTLLLVLIGCGQNEPEAVAPKRIFFITIDTLRADHLGAYGYPRPTSPTLDRLAGEGVLFEQAIAQWPKTTPSFASMFTGQYPQTTGMTHRAAKWLSGDYVTLAEMIQSAGYWTGAVVSNPMLSISLGWDQGFAEFWETWQTDEDLGSDPARYRTVINALRVNELALPLLERAKEHDQSFIWLHYSDPHAPYILPPDVENPFLGDEFDTSPDLVEGKIAPSAKIEDQERLGFYVAQYDANIRIADRLIGEILETAEVLGLLEDSLIVFTSDHGEGMGEHKSYFKHGTLPYNTGSHVPLFFLFSDEARRGRQVDLPVELIDLYPTLRELVAADTAVELEGTSLVPFLAGPDSGERIDPTQFDYAFSEAGHPMALRSYYRSVQDQRWKLVFHPEVDHPRKGQASPLIELYDLHQDPMEQNNLAGLHDSEFGRLWDALSEWMRQGGESDSTDQAEDEGHSEETRKALEALGYLD